MSAEVAESSAGKLIVLEGIDGAGTTTQAERLVQHLRAAGTDCVLTREPTRGPVGALLRAALSGSLSDATGQRVGALDFRSMALLFAADRADHNRRLIEPALARGAWVVSDRYLLSSLIYQSSTAPAGCGSEGEVVAWLAAINVAARSPDLTVVVDVSADVAATRRAKRGGAAELYEFDELQQRLASAYARAEHFAQGHALCHVDGDAELEQVEQRIWQCVARLDSRLGAE